MADVSAMGRSKKSLGQHFLTDHAAIRRIVEAVPEGTNVLEIGPGRGAITEHLLRRAGRLVVIEKDDRFAMHWQQKARDDSRLSAVHADVLKALAQTMDQYRPQWIAGNLPYNISGPLSAALFAHVLSGGMVLMYQREVGDRIMAGPGSRRYGGLSVLARHHYDVNHLLSLPPGAFSPPPRVHSVVLLFIPHGHKPVCSYQQLQRAVRQGFGHRRKTVANNFKGSLTADDWLELGIDPQARPEQLGYASWARLAERLHH